MCHRGRCARRSSGSRPTVWLFSSEGGNNPDTTFVALVLAEGDRELYRATGDDAEVETRSVVWDVAKYKGQSAYLRLVDQSSGGWGHVNLDYVRELTPEDIAARRSARNASGSRPSRRDGKPGRRR